MDIFKQSEPLLFMMLCALLTALVFLCMNPDILLCLAIYPATLTLSGLLSFIIEDHPLRNTLAALALIVSILALAKQKSPVYSGLLRNEGLVRLPRN